jgi:uncharacterized membrane protein
MKKGQLAQWRANFFAGLAIVLPVVISIALVVWLFGTVANITDTLLFFLPKRWTHKDNGAGPMHWYWSLVALLVAILLIGGVGRLARNYIGKKLIGLVDLTLLKVPLLNKIYGTIKQVNEAFSPNKKSAFRQVVLVQFPRAGYYSIGFLTGDQHPEVETKTRGKVLSVFVPTTPNPTSGYLVLVPEADVTLLDMSVADGIKFIISLGSVTPEYTPRIEGKTISLPGSQPDVLTTAS